MKTVFKYFIQDWFVGHLYGLVPEDRCSVSDGLYQQREILHAWLNNSGEYKATRPDSAGLITKPFKRKGRTP